MSFLVVSTSMISKDLELQKEGVSLFFLQLLAAPVHIKSKLRQTG